MNPQKLVEISDEGMSTWSFRSTFRPEVQIWLHKTRSGWLWRTEESHWSSRFTTPSLISIAIDEIESQRHRIF